MTAPDETERLAALQRYGVLDIAPEEVFDRIARLICRALDVPIGLVAFLYDDRLWLKARVGIDAEALPVDAFAEHTASAEHALVVPDAHVDPRFAHLPLVTAAPRVRAYAGVPLRTPEGVTIGVVSALDLRPRAFGSDLVAALRDLAAIAIEELERRTPIRARALADAEARARRSEAALQERVRVLEAVLQTAGDAILVVDVDGRYEVFNEAARKLLGRASGEVPPLERAREYGVFETDGVTPMALDRLPLVRALRGEAVEGETLWLRNEVNPEGVFLSAAARPLRNDAGAVRGAVGTFANVTRLKEAKTSLTRAREQLADRVDILEAVLESAGEGIMVADADARLIVANPIGRFLIGHGPGEMAFRSEGWTREVGIYRADGRTIVPAGEFPLMRAVRGEPTYGVELYVRNERIPDGRYLQVTGRAIRDASGRPRGGVIVLSDITLLKHTQAQVAALALHDELTGLPNRRAFRERLELLIAEAARGRAFALTLVDIDHFKRINDVHGHGVGDQVLVAAARTLQAHVRRCDLVARIGGEEFCVLQAGVAADAAELAERLRVALQSMPGSVPVTASFGVAHSDVIAGDAMLRGADQALYRAKRGGRNRVEVADPDDVAPARVAP